MYYDLFISFEDFFKDEFLQRRYTLAYALKWTKMEKNTKTKINLSRDAFYATESPTNIS